jgi:hypothetical protein
MPQIADYVVLRDSAVSLKPGSDIDIDLPFNLPSDTATGTRGVLSATMNTVDAGDLTFMISVNGANEFNLRSNSDVFRSIQEVVGGLQTGANTVTMKVTGGDGTLVIRDVVLWFQRNI